MTRLDDRRRGLLLAQELGLADDAAAEPLPGYAHFAAEVCYAGIWDRPHLGRQDRLLCTLAVLGLYEQRDALARMIAAALEGSLSPRTILEVFMQAGLYGGFVTTESACAVARDVFAMRGVTLDPEPDRNDSLETLDKRGRDLMSELHGARSTGGYAAPGNPITGSLYPAAIRYGYGELWFRIGLTHRQRMLVAIASFTALGLDGQLSKFGQSALNLGLTRDEIIEAVIQTGPYSGFPRALNGLGILSAAFDNPDE